MNHLVDHFDFLSVCHQQLPEITRAGLSREVNITWKRAGEGERISLCPGVTLQSTWSGQCLPVVYQMLLLAGSSNRKQSFAAVRSFLAFLVSHSAVLCVALEKTLQKGSEAEMPQKGVRWC